MSDRQWEREEKGRKMCHANFDILLCVGTFKGLIYTNSIIIIVSHVPLVVSSHADSL